MSAPVRDRRDEQQNGVNRVLWGYQVLVQVAFPVLLGISSWTFMTMWDHEQRLTRVEATNEQDESSRAARDAVVAKLQADLADVRVGIGSLTAMVSQIRDELRQGRRSQ